MQLPAPSCPIDSARGSCRAGGGSEDTTAAGRWLCPAPSEQRWSRGHPGAGGQWFECALPGDTWTGSGQAGEGTSGDGHVDAMVVAAGCGGRGRALLTWLHRGFAFRNGERTGPGLPGAGLPQLRGWHEPPRALGASC